MTHSADEFEAELEKLAVNIFLRVQGGQQHRAVEALRTLVQRKVREHNLKCQNVVAEYDILNHEAVFKRPIENAEHFPQEMVDMKIQITSAIRSLLPEQEGS